MSGHSLDVLYLVFIKPFSLRATQLVGPPRYELVGNVAGDQFSFFLTKRFIMMSIIVFCFLMAIIILCQHMLIIM